MRTSKLIALIIAFVILLSCDKEKDEPTPNENTNENSNNTDNSSNEFSNAVVKFNNVVSDLDSGYASLSKFGSLSLFKITISNDVKNFNSYEIVTIDLYLSNSIEAKTYTVDNYVTPLGNTMSYGGLSLSSVYNNVSCDATYEIGDNNYGEKGTVIITNVDTINKKISGTFEMNLCRGLIETNRDYINVSGTFTDVEYFNLL